MSTNRDDHAATSCSQKKPLIREKLAAGGGRRGWIALGAQSMMNQVQSSRGSWSESGGRLDGRSSGSGRSQSWGHSRGHSGSDSDNWRKEKPAAGHQMAELKTQER